MNQTRIPTWKILALLMMFVPVGLLAQAQTINGTVTDIATGEPLPGVTVIVKNTTVGAVTDFEGNYTIQAATGSTLVFSYIGYGTEEVVVDERIVISSSSVVCSPSCTSITILSSTTTSSVP